MSLLDQQYEEQKSHLIKKGYDPVSIGTAEQENLYWNQFRANLSEAIHEALLFNEPTTFTHSISGLFNNNKDIVHFNFSYEFDPELQDLFLKKMHARMGNEQLNFDITNSEQLPLAISVHALLKQNQLKKVSEELDEINESKVQVRRHH